MSRIEVARSFGRTDGPTKAACSMRSKVKRKGKRWIHGRKDTQTHRRMKKISDVTGDGDYPRWSGSCIISVKKAEMF